MRWLSILALLFLSGCWFGGNFYSQADLTPALPPGDYRVTSQDGRRSNPDILRISMRADGLTRVVVLTPDGREDNRDVYFLGFVPMGTDGRLFAASLTNEEGEEARPEAEKRVFLLLRRENNGFSLLAPVCDSSVADVVRRAGGRIIASRPSDVCEFDDRASLEAALRAAEPSLRIWLRLESIPAP